MTDYIKCNMKRVETKAGETIYLLVEWLTDGLFNIEATNGVEAWKAERCGYQPGIQLEREEWLEKSFEALGFEANSSTHFTFDSFCNSETGCRELFWMWGNENDGQIREKANVVLSPCEVLQTIPKLLSAACDLSSTLTVLTKESKAIQAAIEEEMDAVHKEVKHTLLSRKALYQRCTEVIKEKNQQLKELEKQNDVMTVQNEQHYPLLKTDQDVRS